MGDHALDADYLVVGAGAMGMAFVDTLVTETDASVVMVDRRHAPGGHWLDAYPFVRLHQPSNFYGVDSTPLGTGARQSSGPEEGLYERATAGEICGYYARVMHDRLIPSGQVRFFPKSEHVDGTRFESRLTGDSFNVRVRQKVVDATLSQTEIPSQSAPPFEVADGVQCVPVNELAHLDDAPERYVIVGGGKTAMDACVWLLQQRVDPQAITWIRPRDAWLTNRDYFQTDELVGDFFQMVALTFEAAAAASSLDDLFLRLEADDVMLRTDPDVAPTMARTPTIAHWEIDLLRTITDVVRQGHVRRIERDQIILDKGTVPTGPGTLHVHCASKGITDRAPVPIFDADTIRLQAVRAAFPCYGAAVTGFVEAHWDADADKNRLCPSTPNANNLADWARMWALGQRADLAHVKEPAIREWAQQSRLNAARVPPEQMSDPAVQEYVRRYLEHVGPGVERLTELAATG